jgi:mRNA interferase MazF
VPANDPETLEAGDLVWLEFGPPFGHEQAGRRPAVVVSPQIYNKQSSLILVCPITRNLGAWAFKVEIPKGTQIQGTILVDQVRSIDPRARFARREESVDASTLDRVYGILATLFGIPVSN